MRTHKPKRFHGDQGSVSAEYAILAVAAVAFAGVLLKVLTSAPVHAALSAIIERALQ